MTKKVDWEKRFGESFVNHGEFIYIKGGYPAVCGDIKRFISSLFQSFADEVREKVIGEDDVPTYDNPQVSFWSAKKRNQLRQEQRQALTDLCKKYGL